MCASNTVVLLSYAPRLASRILFSLFCCIASNFCCCCYKAIAIAAGYAQIARCLTYTVLLAFIRLTHSLTHSEIWLTQREYDIVKYESITVSFRLFSSRNPCNVFRCCCCWDLMLCYVMFCVLCSASRAQSEPRGAFRLEPQNDDHKFPRLAMQNLRPAGRRAKHCANCQCQFCNINLYVLVFIIYSCRSIRKEHWFPKQNNIKFLAVPRVSHVNSI